MSDRKQKSFVASGKNLKHKWYVLDASDRILGRMATRIATVLMGKHKPTYTPFLDTGDFVVVVNAEKIRVTGRKADQKRYQRFSGYPSGRRELSFREMLEKRPTEIVRLAVKRMLPRSTLGRQLIGKLKVYMGPEHPHQAQQPVPLEVR